jgi:hypothetical protein
VGVWKQRRDGSAIYVAHLPHAAGTKADGPVGTSIDVGKLIGPTEEKHAQG